MTRFVHLDALRATAAILVMAGHLRAFLCQSYAELQSPGPLAKIFYLVTGLGHQAVIVFFALSGFLVGGRAFQSIALGTFGWQDYLLRRFTRLWIVMVPALLLTWFFDRLGLALSGGRGYDGSLYGIYVSGPHEPPVYSLTDFIGNVLFLGNIRVPVFGTNGPLWSLSNEFWYYVIFPLCAWIFVAGNALVPRLAGAIVLAALLLLIPVWVIQYGVIWIAGALTALLVIRAKPGWIDERPPVAPLAFAALFLAILAAKQSFIGDIGLGVITAVILPLLTATSVRSRCYSRASIGLSEISYTLYLTHFPLLAFVIFVFLSPTRLGLGPITTLLYAGLFGLTLCWAALVWWCFERNTSVVYRWFHERLCRVSVLG